MTKITISELKKNATGYKYKFLFFNNNTNLNTPLKVVCQCLFFKKKKLFRHKAYTNSTFWDLTEKSFTKSVFSGFLSSPNIDVAKVIHQVNTEN